MKTKQPLIEYAIIAEIENILEEDWITEEDRFRCIFNGHNYSMV